MFCERCYSSENLKFVVDVCRYKAHFADNKHFWTALEDKSAPESPQDSGIWPCALVEPIAAEQRAISIWRQYLENNAPEQVCVSSGIAAQIANRLRFYVFSAPFVFDDALQEVKQILLHSILPLFKKSAEYAEMADMKQAVINLPQFFDESTVPRPILKMEGRSSSVTLTDVLTDANVYDRFMIFLKGRACAENLLCKNLIVRFKATFDGINNNIVESKRLAKIIFLHVVAIGSVHEICLQASKLDIVKFGLSCPYKELFNILEITVNEVLLYSLAIFSSLNPLNKNTDIIKVRRRTTVELALMTVGNGFNAFRSQKNLHGGNFPGENEKCGHEIIRFPAIKTAAVVSTACGT